MVGCMSVLIDLQLINSVRGGGSFVIPCGAANHSLLLIFVCNKTLCHSPSFLVILPLLFQQRSSSAFDSLAACNDQFVSIILFCIPFIVIIIMNIQSLVLFLTLNLNLNCLFWFNFKTLFLHMLKLLVITHRIHKS